MGGTEAGAPGWRALPVAAIAALYVTGVQRILRENLLAFMGAGTGLAVSDAFGWREFLAFALLVLLIGLLLALVHHRRFRYRIDDDSVRVRRGLFEQTELEVRFERVQNVGFSQPFYLRPLGLRRVTLETPGAAQTEVELPGIAEDEALALRERVAGAPCAVRGEVAAPGAERGPIGAAAPAGEEIFRAGAADLFRYGMTSNQVWLLLAFVGGPAANWLERRADRAVAGWTEAGAAAPAIPAELLETAPWIAGLLLLAGLAATALLLVLASGVLAVVRFHGFTLTRDGDSYRARFGLLDVRERALRRAKLHSVEFVQTAVGRLLGSWHLVGHQTGGALAGPPSAGDDRRLLVPGIRGEQLPAVLGALSRPGRNRDLWYRPALHPVHRRLRSFGWTRLCAPLALLAAGLAGLAGLTPASPGPAPVVAAGAALLAVLVHLRWKRWGWLYEDDRLIVRSGLVGERWIAFDLDRCQQVRITTSPHQRRHGLASLHLRLPHGEQTVPYLPAGVAAELANRALLAAERSASHAL